METQTAHRRNTRQRALVLDAVTARCDHPTADDVYADVSGIDPRVSRGTVYRNLNLLVQTGAVKAVRTSGATRFDRRTDEHAHVTCVVCGKVLDAPVAYDGALDELMARETGFTSMSHGTVFEGVCPACQRAAAQAQE